MFRGPWRLRTHLLSVLAITLLPGFVLTGMVALQVSRSALAHYDHVLADMASTMAIAFDRQIEMIARVANADFATGAADNGDLTDGATALARLHVGQRVEVALWRRQEGREVRFPPRSGDEIPPEVTAAVARALATQRVQIEVETTSRAAGAQAVLLYVPLARGRTWGVLQLALPSEVVGDMLGFPATPGGLTARLMRLGAVVPSGPDASHAVPLALLDPRFDAIASYVPPRRVRRGAVADFGDGRDYLAGAALLHAPDWYVVVVDDEAARASSWKRSMVVLAVPAIVPLVAGLIAAAFLVGRLIRPLATLTLDASAVALSGEASGAGSALSRVSEFNELQASLRRSTTLLRRRVAAERMALTEARTGHELLASVVAATEDLLYVKDLELRIVLANRAARCVGGATRAEWQLLGRRIDVLLPGDGAMREEALDCLVMANGESATMRLVWPSVTGMPRTFDFTKSPWRSAAGGIIGVVTVAHDATEQQAAQARIAGVQADLLRASRLSAMGAMASGLAHELNQPLAAATNFINAAKRLMAPPDQHTGILQGRADRLAHTAVRDAGEQLLRAGDIVRRLRAFIGRGEAALRPEDLGVVIREACDLARVDGAAGLAELVVHSDGIGHIALLDRTQLQQVLLNLIRNASEALSDAPGARIEICCEPLGDGGTRIRVADNGPGLAPQVARRLFQPFVSTKPNGMGIGLAICRTIVEGHGGLLSAAARPDRGTVFTILLPPVLAQMPRDAVHAA